MSAQPVRISRRHRIHRIVGPWIRPVHTARTLIEARPFFDGRCKRLANATPDDAWHVAFDMLDWALVTRRKVTSDLMRTIVARLQVRCYMSALPSMTTTREATVNLFTLDQIREAGLSRLSPEIRAFLEGGSGAETTLTRNQTAFDEIRFVPRVMSGLPFPATSTSLLGIDLSLPIVTASVPMATSIRRANAPSLDPMPGSALPASCPKQVPTPLRLSRRRRRRRRSSANCTRWAASRTS